MTNGDTSFYEDETDDREAFAAERTARNPEFGALVAQARERRTNGDTRAKSLDRADVITIECGAKVARPHA
jgi:hypothetical protein